MVERIAIILCAFSVAGAEPRTTYRMETVAGTLDMGDGGPALLAEIGAIQGIAVDNRGNVYLSDTDHHRVRRIDPTGVITLVAGTGTPGFFGDGGPAAAAQLSLPYGLATDFQGNLYIADLGNNRVRRVGPDGMIRTVAGTGQKGSAGDGGPAASAQLMAPRNLAADNAGNLFISEFEGHRVRKVGADGRIITVAGIGIAGFRGDGGYAGAAQFDHPAGLALDRGGTLYICDSGNARLRRLLPSGIVGTVLGGTSATKLSVPVAVAIDTSGTIYLADTFPGRVISYTAAGSLSSVTGAQARDLAVDLNGHLYLADGVYIRQVNVDGTIQIIAGDGYLNAIGDGGSATSARLSRPAAVALDGAGNLYVADTGTNRIRKVDASGQISTVAGNGIAFFWGDGGPAPASMVAGPLGVVAAGGLIFADSGNRRVRSVSAGGTISTLVGPGTAGVDQEGLSPSQTFLFGPRGLCQDRAGALYIADGDRVLRVSPGTTVATAAGNGSPGDGGDGGLGRLAQLRGPSACAADSAGNLFVADTSNQRIRKISADGTISTVAGTGIPGFTGDGGPATAANLYQPGGIAVDDGGNIFIADTGNNRIRQIDSKGTIQTIADGLDGPGGLALDGSGSLYLADTNHNLIRRLTPQSSPPEPVEVPLPEVSAVNAASLQSGPIAPGEIVTLFGVGLGPQVGVPGTTDEAGVISSLVGGTEVRFDDVAAPVLYAQSSQVNVQAPYTIAAFAQTRIEVRYQGRTAGTLAVGVSDSAPGLFPTVRNQDGSLNSETEPAERETVMMLFGTGEGLGSGTTVAGKPAAPPYLPLRQPVSLTVGGVPAELLYAGPAPGLVGLVQINARVPGAFVPPGPAPAVWSVGGGSSPPITIWLK